MSVPTTPTSSAGMFQVKQRVYALQQGTLRRATIMEVSTTVDGSTQYYVRFLDQDSRMDAWYSGSELRLCEVKAVKSSNPVVAPTIQTRAMASRQSLQSQGDGGTLSNAAIIVGDEPPKRQPIVQDIATKRQRKDSSFFFRPKNVSRVLIGRYDVAAWYFSPYHCARSTVRACMETCAPHFLSDLGAEATLDVRQDFIGSSKGGASAPYPSRTRSSSATPFVLHLCPFCLEPFSCHNSVVRHIQYTCIRHPPGCEVYRDPDFGIVLFELDGKAEPVFANNLALLSKLFLEHKALDCDMTPFLFYVLCQVTSYGCEVVGYFSKEKISPDNFNLSCILTLPQFQGRGIGRFLVEVSYEITRREGKVGSPEKPLSDLGEVTYMSFWKDVVMDVLAAAADKGSGVSIQGIVAATCMTQQDVIVTLQKLNILSGGGGKQNRKFSLCLTSEHVRQHEERKARRLANRSSSYIFDPALLCWHPSWYEHRSEVPPKRLEGIFTEQ